MRRSRNESRELPVLDQDLGNDSDIGDSEPARVREPRGVGSLEVDSGVRADVDLMGAGVLCPIVEAGRRVEADAEGG